MRRRFHRYAWLVSRVDWHEIAQVSARYWDRYERAIRSGHRGRARLFREILLDLVDWLERRS